MSLVPHPTQLLQELDIPVSDWQQTPASVQDTLLSLLKRVNALKARYNRNSFNSRRPPSTDSVTTKRERRKLTTERRKPGAKPGHPGHQQILLQPTTTVALFPDPCGCGHIEMTNLRAYQTYQVIELPVIRPEVTHWRLHQGQYGACGKLHKASLPTDQTTGYGPRLTAFVGVMSGIVSVSRSSVQDVCSSVFGIPLSKGAIQKMIDRVSEALVPYYEAIRSGVQSLGRIGQITALFTPSRPSPAPPAAPPALAVTAASPGPRSKASSGLARSGPATQDG